jgi:hypothetical protein
MCHPNASRLCNYQKGDRDVGEKDGESSSCHFKPAATSWKVAPFKSKMQGDDGLIPIRVSETEREGWEENDDDVPS